MRFRSFKRGTVSLFMSKGCKTTSCQIWRSEKNPAPRPTSNHTSAAQVWFLDDTIILQLWQLVTLQPLDLQRSTVTGKISTSLTNTVSIERTEKTERIFNTSYSLSKWPHLLRAYLLGLWNSFSVTVNFKSRLPKSRHFSLENNDLRLN